MQELKILETLPFDKNVVQFHGSCAQDGNILLVLEYMQVTINPCIHPLPGCPCDEESNEQLVEFLPNSAFASAPH